MPLHSSSSTLALLGSSEIKLTMSLHLELASLMMLSFLFSPLLVVYFTIVKSCNVSESDLSAVILDKYSSFQYKLIITIERSGGHIRHVCSILLMSCCQLYSASCQLLDYEHDNTHAPHEAHAPKLVCFLMIMILV